MTAFVPRNVETASVITRRERFLELILEQTLITAALEFQEAQNNNRSERDGDPRRVTSLRISWIDFSD